MKKKKLFEESGHGLVWCEFVERGCPAKKEDYFITEKDLLNLDLVKERLKQIRKKTRKKVEKKLRVYIENTRCMNCQKYNKKQHNYR